ncbi:MAG: metallophosphoesterase [Acidobacteriota bacterium]
MDIIRTKFTELHDIRNIAILADPACRDGWEGNFLPLLERVWREHRPELFLVAGDFAVNGTSDEFRNVLTAMKKYPAQLAAVPGDHDRPLKTFTKYFGTTRKIIDVGNWRFIGLNTANRIFPQSEAEFLNMNIQSRTVVFCHVPPGVDGWTFHSLSPLYSERFLSIIERHRSKVTAAFFGHIHGYSRCRFMGIPFIAIGGVAESYRVRRNRYDGPGPIQMLVLDLKTGKFSLCRKD